MKRKHRKVNRHITYKAEYTLQQTRIKLKTLVVIDSGCRINIIYMIDSDRRPVSNRRPLLKSASIDIIISNHGPILGYSQIGVLSKLSYLYARLHDQSLPSKIKMIVFGFLICFFNQFFFFFFKYFPIL
jgi:tetrahydromethanopterin S-methyltransferase subunit E